MVALKLQNVSKYYASQTAVVMGLSDINLSFSVGEFVAVTGENGSGKSTLANVIGGMLPYEGGELYVMGQPTSHYNAADWERYRRDLIGFISQDYGILPGNTVFENVESALILSGCERKTAKKKTREILEKVELTEYSRRRAAKLSSGQKQRLAIARALAKPSKILIADEPTGNLDRENSDKVIRLLKEASKDRLVILITHEFSEAKDYITRHIVLSDGKVVQDIDFGIPEENKIEAAPDYAKKTRTSRKESGLPLYIARLTSKARPVFFILTFLILLLTSVASFVFIGNFIISMDDTPSRSYDSSAFLNGDKKRIVLVKEGKESFDDDEIETIKSQNFVTSVEKYGYLCDVNYYYRSGIDYQRYTSADFLPGYNKLENPDAFVLTVKYTFSKKDPLYLQSVTQAGVVINGKKPEGFYEVLSADPDVKTGSQIIVFIKDKAHWPTSEYLKITFDVVGETLGTKGLYFSESFCRMLNNSTLNKINESNKETYAGGDLGKYPVAPYEADRYWEELKDAELVVVPEPATPSPPPREGMEHPAIVTPEPTLEPTKPEEIGDKEFIYPYSDGYNAKRYGDYMELIVGNGLNTGDFDENSIRVYELTCRWLFESKHSHFTLVSQRTFDKMTGSMGSNQVTVYINDYSYTDRVINEMESLGYFAVSPFRQGATKLDQKLETDRINLLRISIAAAVLTLVLQLILLRVTFSSLKEQYKLLSNMGLRAKTAYASLAVIFAFLTVIAEIVGVIAINIMNYYEYSRVVNIFKYMGIFEMVLIFGIHFVFCAAAYLIVARSMKKQVFSVNGYYEDVDGELMEEVMAQ